MTLILNYFRINTINDGNEFPAPEPEESKEKVVRTTSANEFWLMFEAKRPTWNATRTLFTLDHF